MGNLTEEAMGMVNVALTLWARQCRWASMWFASTWLLLMWLTSTWLMWDLPTWPLGSRWLVNVLNFYNEGNLLGIYYIFELQEREKGQETSEEAMGDGQCDIDAVGTSTWLASMPLGVDVVRIDVARIDVAQKN